MHSGGDYCDLPTWVEHEHDDNQYHAVDTGLQLFVWAQQHNAEALSYPGAIAAVTQPDTQACLPFSSTVQVAAASSEHGVRVCAGLGWRRHRLSQPLQVAQRRPTWVPKITCRAPRA